MIAKYKILKSLKFFFIVICVFRINYGNCYAIDDFLTELFKPVELTKLGIVTPHQYLNLTKIDKQNLNDAKNTLISFLKSFKVREESPLEYLHPLLQKIYPDRVTLYREEFNAETILEIKIFNFVVKGKNRDEIIFYVKLTDTTEGIDRMYPTAFALMKDGHKWKISRFGRNIKDWREELNQR